MRRWARLVLVPVLSIALWGGSMITAPPALAATVEERLAALEARIAVLERAAAISSLNVPKLVEQASPAVVSVYNVDEMDEVYSEGTAFFISADGLAITNSHVVDEGHKLKVKLAGGVVEPAEVVFSDPFMDIAVIAVEGSDFPTLAWAKQKPVPGEPLVVIGNAWGYSNSVTVGVVSGVDRPDPSHLYHYPSLQTDAAVNHGNSGGPMLNARGEVVAVASWTELKGETEGLGFGVPADLIQKALSKLDKDRGLVRPWLGISVREPYWARGGLTNTLGLVVSGVHPKSSAARAGLTKNDWITAVDGVPVNDLMSLRADLEAHKPGDVISLAINRRVGGKYVDLTLKVTLGESSAVVDPLVPAEYDDSTDDVF